MMQFPIACDRCGVKFGARGSTVSWFNTDRICMECSADEHDHPDIGKAKEAEHAAVKRGNYDFGGIGLPNDFKVATRKEAL